MRAVIKALKYASVEACTIYKYVQGARRFSISTDRRSTAAFEFVQIV